LVVVGVLGLSAAAGTGGAPAATAAVRLAVAAAGLRAGQTGARSAVPWRHVGPGWVLAMYWSGRFVFAGKPKAAAPVLYLFDPAGGRYRIRQWPVTRNPPSLMDWSGDKTRALVSTSTSTMEQVVLATGKLNFFRLPGQAAAIGYTRPRGLGVLGFRTEKSGFELARYRLDGELAKELVPDAQTDTAVYSPSGATLAVGARRGVWLVSNDGGVIRTLPIPGATGRCFASRWWNSQVILASCTAAGSRSRLWLVPAGGSKPTPLTAQRGKHSPDHGDLGAWRLHGRLYLQAMTYEGDGRIFRQAADGQAISVTVPRTPGNNWIDAARGPRLLISAITPCYEGSSLLWYSPATGREVRLISRPPGRQGVLGSVSYGQPTAGGADALGLC
jgi:hypothetical protein